VTMVAAINVFMIGSNVVIEGLAGRGKILRDLDLEAATDARRVEPWFHLPAPTKAFWAHAG
jgi:hypothetical protein